MCDHVVAPDRSEPCQYGFPAGSKFDLFRLLAAAIDDANVVWNGLQRLEVVSVTLDQDCDEPQLVFESMNSTGLDLETSDLVRNYMLMGCCHKQQAFVRKTSIKTPETLQMFARFYRVFFHLLELHKS